MTHDGYRQRQQGAQSRDRADEEVKQVTGSARVSIWAVAVAVIVGGFLFTLGWLSLR